MKKHFSLLPLLAALAAPVFAETPANEKLAAYKAKMLEYADVLNPVVKTPDNLVKRYKMFRAPMLKDMAGYADPALMFGWGEPLFFIPENFVRRGEGEWNVDYDDLLELGEVVDPAFPGVKWYRFWVGEIIEDDAMRTWVVTSRNSNNADGMGEPLYEIPAGCGDAYMPFKQLNFMLLKMGFEPTRNDDGTWVADYENWFMGLIYWLHDPARYRMAVNLMDYRDWLLLQHAKGKPPGDYTNPGGGGGGGGILPPSIVPTYTNSIRVVSIDAPSYSTNQMYVANANTVDIYTHTNHPANARQSHFYVVNNSPNKLLKVSWTTNSVAAGHFNLNGPGEFRTNLFVRNRAQIVLEMPPRTSNNDWYGLDWGVNSVHTNTFNDVSLNLSTNFYFNALSYETSSTHIYNATNSTAAAYPTLLSITNNSPDKVVHIAWMTNSVPAGQTPLAAKSGFITNLTMHASAQISINMPPRTSANDWYGIEWLK